MQDQPFDIEKAAAVGYVDTRGETLIATVTGVSEAGNPNLNVLRQTSDGLVSYDVPDAQRDPDGAPGTWNYIGAAPEPEPAPIAEEAPSVAEVPVVEETEAPQTEASAEPETPQGEETSEAA